jgi:hypothetical protein
MKEGLLSSSENNVVDIGKSCNIEQDFWCIVVEYLSKCVDIYNLRLCSKELMSICRKSLQCIVIHTENMKTNRIKETFNFRQLMFCSNNSLEDRMLHSLSSNKTDLTLIVTKCFRMKDVCGALKSCRNAALCDVNFQSHHNFPSFNNHQLDNLRILILTNCSFETDTLIELLISVPKTLIFLGFGGTVGLQENLLSVLHHFQMNADHLAQEEESFEQIEVEENTNPNWEFINPHSQIERSDELDESSMSVNRYINIESSVWGDKKSSTGKKTSLKPRNLSFIIEVTFLQKSEKILLHRLFPTATLLDLQSDTILEIEEVIFTVLWCISFITSCLIFIHAVSSYLIL